MLAADKSDWCGSLELMATNPVKIEKIYNDKLGRYDEPIGDQILGVSLGAATNVTRLHEWTIEYRPGSSIGGDIHPPIGSTSIGASIGGSIVISPIGDFSNQPQRAKLALESCQ